MCLLSVEEMERRRLSDLIWPGRPQGPLFFHTQLHLLFLVHFTEHVHTEAQRCTNKQLHSRKSSAFLMGKKETICVFILT